MFHPLHPAPADHGLLARVMLTLAVLSALVLCLNWGPAGSDIADTPDLAAVPYAVPAAGQDGSGEVATDSAANQATQAFDQTMFLVPSY